MNILRPTIAALALSLAASAAAVDRPLDARLVLRNPEAFYTTPATPDPLRARLAPLLDEHRKQEAAMDRALGLPEVTP